jgi:periplasmic copper chaperone A
MPAYMRSHLAIFAAAALVFAASAAAHEIKAGGLRVTHPWCKFLEASPGALSAIIKITNTGHEDDRLIGASFGTARTVLLNDHKIEDMPGLAIPAGAAVAIKPSTVPLTFAKIDEMPVEGQIVSGTLTFEKAGVVAVEFEIGG